MAKKTIHDYMEQYIQKFGQEKFDNLDWTNAEYITANKPIKGLICKKHDTSIAASASSFLVSKSGGCRYCGYDQVFKQTSDGIEMFKEKYLQKFGQEKYDNMDWSNAVYHSSTTPIDNLLCRKHNLPILSKPVTILQTSVCGGCKQCASELKRSNFVYSLGDYKAAFIKKFGTERYETLDWSKVKFTNGTGPIKNLRCIKHDHIINYGSAAHLLKQKENVCEYCLREIKNNNKLNDFKQKYLDNFDIEAYNSVSWDEVEYVSSHEPLTNFICIKHNKSINKSPYEIITGNNHGCSECGKELVSNCVHLRWMSLSNGIYWHMVKQNMIIWIGL